MALKPLEIFKLLPKTNCKDCGFPTCLAFAMQIATGKVELAKCPHVSEEAKAQLSAESAPPIRTIILGQGDSQVKIGGETVLYRHEKTFCNPPVIGVLINESMAEEEADRRLAALAELRYDRVGLKLGAEMAAIRDEGGSRFSEIAQKACRAGHLLLLMSDDPARLREAAEACATARPVLFAADEGNWEEMGALAGELGLPLAVRGETVEQLAATAGKLAEAGAADLVLCPAAAGPSSLLRDLTLIRRAAIIGKNRALGYPVLALSTAAAGGDPMREALDAGLCIARYAGAVVLSDLAGETLFPLLLERLNIFTDPQRPLTTPEGVYEVGKPDEKSPVLVTTNFSLTYFIVSGEAENARRPAWLLVQDTEGLSVLTAWAADKFNAGTIAALVRKVGLDEKCESRALILPGAVASIFGELEEELPGWKILLGPREASNLPAFLKNLE